MRLPAVRTARPYARPVPDRLPLFPLGMVLFPGLLLPLHVFEERYRQLISELVELPEAERRFGVVAIREGREVGEDAIGGLAALHEIGCTARLRRVHQHPDGRYEIVTSGSERFRLTGLSHDRPYLTGMIEWLPDEVGDPSLAGLLDQAVRAGFSGYVQALGESGGQQVELPELPDDPLVFSHLVAATIAVDLAERQALLAEPDGCSRLRSELKLLRRETVLLQVLRSAPASELTRGPVSLN